jgi:tetratricopeptide (TPR) repeat protein
MRRRGCALALLLVLAAACSTARSSSPPAGGADSRDRGRPSSAARLVAHGDDLAAGGQAPAAAALYEQALREHPGDPAGAAALYGLGRIQTDASSGLRNYRAALATFSRLLADYPRSRWESEARAWRAVLTDLLARDEEAARLKSQIERLRRTDLDLERRR